jgi:hypothetical protein
VGAAEKGLERTGLNGGKRGNMSTTSKFTKRALRLLAAATVSAGVFVPAVAMAQEGGDEYPTPSSTPAVPSTVTGVGGRSATEDPGGVSATEDPGGAGGSLPVTGGQIAGLTLIGLGITGAGVVMVRLGRRPVGVET